MNTDNIDTNIYPQKLSHWFGLTVVAGILWAVIYLCVSTAFAADYRYEQPQQYQQPYATPPAQQQQQTVVVQQQESQYHEQRRTWNPIGAIMAVPRAALRVPGAILGGDDYGDE